MILLIDHYDSFTYNIYQAIAAMDVEVEVVRYGALTLDEIKSKNPQAIILSPGPGHPLELPESIELIQELHQSIPILGICLGQQLIGAAFGGKVVQAPFIRMARSRKFRMISKGYSKTCRCRCRSCGTIRWYWNRRPWLIVWKYNPGHLTMTRLWP